MNTKEYERIAALYLDCIYRVAINGCKNYADAEDVVQNTFIKLWEKENNFEDDHHARKWLIRVAYFTYGDLAIDITEDLKDGEAIGIFEKDGITQQYKVTGSAGEWSVEIELQIEN